MSVYQVKSPIVIFIFKRPEKFKKIIEVIRKVQPEKIFIIGDGARIEVDGETSLVNKTRSLVSEIDWSCDIFTNYSDINMGGPKRIPTGLNWVFENVSEAIILEDDIIPSISFFQFCDEMLDKYRETNMVMHVSGGNRGVTVNNSSSYHFGAATIVKGWATWRNSWNQFGGICGKSFKYDPSEKLLKDISFNEEILYPRLEKWVEIKEDLICNWDLRWLFSVLANRGVSVIPNVNLTENIGYDEVAQHSKNINPWDYGLKAGNMTFPLVHPDEINICKEADYARFKIQKNVMKLVIARVRRLICRISPLLVSSFDRFIFRNRKQLRKIFVFNGKPVSYE